MFRFHLRTLLIFMTLGPPVLALGWWNCSAWRQAQQQREAIKLWLTIDGTMPPPGILRGGK